MGVARLGTMWFFARCPSPLLRGSAQDRGTNTKLHDSQNSAVADPNNMLTAVFTSDDNQSDGMDQVKFHHNEQTASSVSQNGEYDHAAQEDFTENGTINHLLGVGALGGAGD